MQGISVKVTLERLDFPNLACRWRRPLTQRVPWRLEPTRDLLELCMVELVGIEPTTSSLRTMRSPS